MTESEIRKIFVDVPAERPDFNDAHNDAMMDWIWDNLTIGKENDRTLQMDDLMLS